MPVPPSPAAPLVSTVTTADAVAVTPHYLATAAALRILAAGGNAADAAIAANAVQGMVDPTTCGPGGDLFALVHRPGDTAPSASCSAASSPSRWPSSTP